MDNRKKGVIASYIYLVVNIVVNIFYVPILLDNLGKNEYGLYQIVGSVFAYLSIFEASISSGVLRFYCKAFAEGNKNQMENVLAIARIIYRILSLIIILIGIVGIWGFRLFYSDSLTISEINESTIMLIILIINMIVTMANAIYLASINVNEKFALIKVLAMITQIIQPILCVLVLSEFPYALTVTIIQLLVNIIVSIFRYFYSTRKLSVKVYLHKFDYRLGKNIIIFAGSILLASVADQIFWKADQIILGKLYCTEVVAVYAIGSQIYTNYSYVGTAVSSVFFPRLSKLYMEHDGVKKISELFTRVGRISFQILFLVLTGFTIFGQEFITIWVGKEYQEAYLIALMVLVPFTIDLTQNLGLSILQVVNKYSFRAKMYFVAAILNIVSTIFMAKYWGGVGAAASTGITMFITSGLILNLYYSKIIGLDIKLFWNNIIIILGKMFPIVVLSYFFNKIIVTPVNIYILIIKMLLYCIIYIIILYLVAMNKYEKEMMKSIITKMISRIISVFHSRL